MQCPLALHHPLRWAIIRDLTQSGFLSVPTQMVRYEYRQASGPRRPEAACPGTLALFLRALGFCHVFCAGAYIRRQHCCTHYERESRSRNPFSTGLHRQIFYSRILFYGGESCRKRRHILSTIHIVPHQIGFRHHQIDCFNYQFGWKEILARPQQRSFFLTFGYESKTGREFCV